MPSKQAEAFCLHCLEGWSYQQVSQHLSASVDSVGVLIHRARKQLRRLMGIPEPSRGPGSTSPRSSRESP